MQPVLDHKLLRQIVTIANAGGMRAGADLLGTSQPPLSKKIRELEGALGVEIFQRSAHGVALTKAGAALVAEAEPILAALDLTERLVRRYGTAKPALRIGFVSAALDVLLPELLDRITDKGWPTPHLIEATTNDQLAQFAAGQMDLGLLHPPVETPAALSLVELGSQGFVIALPESHPLSALEVIKTHDLIGLPLVLFPQAQGPVLYAAMTRALGQGADLNVVAQATRSHTQLALVATGVGVAVIGTSVANNVTYRGVVYRPWCDRPEEIGLDNALLGPPGLLQDLGYI